MTKKQLAVVPSENETAVAAFEGDIQVTEAGMRDYEQWPADDVRAFEAFRLYLNYNSRNETAGWVEQRERLRRLHKSLREFCKEDWGMTEAQYDSIARRIRYAESKTARLPTIVGKQPEKQLEAAPEPEPAAQTPLDDGFSPYAAAAPPAAWLVSGSSYHIAGGRIAPRYQLGRLAANQSHGCRPDNRAVGLYRLPVRSKVPSNAALPARQLSAPGPLRTGAGTTTKSTSTSVTH